MATPMDWLADRVQVGRRVLTAAALSSLIASIGIVGTGSVVRVTGSGLGCDAWPACTSETLTTTPELGVHGFIEFGNRLLTIGLCLIVGWLILSARLQRPHNRSIARWTWIQFWIIIVNAVVGGITVWMRLSPYVVAAHFVAAFLLLTSATITWHKVQSSTKPPIPDAVSDVSKRLAVWQLVLAGIVILAGTAVTGSGPHAGDSSSVPRMPFDWTLITSLHGVAAVGLLVLAVALRWSVRATTGVLARRVVLLISALVAQALVGVTQAMLSLPQPLVVIHVFLACITWVGSIRVFLDSRPSRPAERTR